MTKYYISLEADGNFHIIEYDTGEGVRVLRDAGGRETSIVIYHNSLIISALYRNWNELAKFTAEWDEKRLLEEAKKHMAELQNDVVA